MGLGQVSVNNLNLNQGVPSEVERLFLFAGEAETNQGTIQAIGIDSDLDAIIGVNDSSLKTQIIAARNNGGQNWYAYALPLAAGTDINVAIDEALDQISVEGVIACDPVSSSTELEALNSTTQNIISKYQRRIFIIASVEGPSASDTWGNYSGNIKTITDKVAAERVCIVPLIWPDFAGALAGRLSRRDISVADSPMRVATGALVGEYVERPVDSAGEPVTLAILRDLHENGRYTVPQWYADYEGVYVSDCYTLAPVTSDYKIIENLRTADKAARRVYLLAVARVADRRLNSTKASVETNKTYFSRPLREMSRSVQFAGEVLPGDIKPPSDDAITIAWPDKYRVQIFLKLQPYNAPKQIEANIILDLSNQEDK